MNKSSFKSSENVLSNKLEWLRFVWTLESLIFFPVDTTLEKFMWFLLEASLLNKINCFKDGFNRNTRFLISKRVERWQKNKQLFAILLPQI